MPLRLPLSRVVPTLALFAACADAPLTTPDAATPPLTPAVAPAVAATTTCDLSWSLPIDGDFSDATNWAPSRTPTATDRVCFAANGLFTVTLTAPSEVNAIVVDDNAAVTFDAASLLELDTRSLEIRRLGRAILGGCFVLASRVTDVTGTLEARPSASCSVANDVGTLSATGLVDMHSAFFIATNFLNGGQLRLTGVNAISFLSRTAVVGTGALVGSGSLRLLSPDTLIWNGDAFPGRSAATGLARVMVDAKRLDLPTVNPASGALDFAGELTTTVPRVVVGDVPAGVDLGLWTGGRYALRHHSPSTTRYTVHGQLTLAPVNGTLLLEVDTLMIANRLVTSYFPTELNTYHFVNRGRVDLTAPLHLAATYLQTIPTFSSHENHGTITTTGAGELVIGTYAQFPLVPTGRMTGRLVLDDGELQGSGTLDVVEARGGVIEPGTGLYGIGTIVMQSLQLSATSETRLQVGGPAPGQADRLRILGTAVLDGELDVRNVNGYAGGQCGDVVPLISGVSAGFASGAFSQYDGFQPATGRAWRLSAAPTVQSLVGFDPRTALSVAPTALALSEGGSPGSASLCLGGPPPTASVTVTPSARRGQLTAIPTPVTFTTSNWDMPQRLSVSAIDDARAEGAHVDSLRFVLASTDTRYTGLARQQLHVDLTDNDPAVDLVLSTVALDTAAALNAQLDARFRVENAGPGASTGSTFTVTPMAGLEFVSNNGGVSCVPTAGVVTCTIGALATGGSVEFTILFRATAVGVHTNTARVAGRDYDATTGNNVLAWVVTIS